MPKTITPANETLTRAIICHLSAPPNAEPPAAPDWAMREYRKRRKDGFFDEGQVGRIEAAVRERAAVNGEAIQLQLF